MKWTLDSDLHDVLKKTDRIFDSLRDTRIFFTGGTGFIGCWMLEALRYADQRFNLNFKVVILTRDLMKFTLKAPHLACHQSFEFVQGQICDFEFPSGTFTHVIHGATDASAYLNETAPLVMFSSIVDGTRRVLDFAEKSGARRVLFMSSGAVYGPQPSSLANVPESWRGGPNQTDPRAAYAEAKRAAELLCSIYSTQRGLDVVIARIFALLGPYLSLDIHFAAGNFIRDAIAGRKIVITGNGSPCRSYLYASDLVVWLFHLLVRADSSKPYNVGSDHSISIKDLAELIAEVLGSPGVEVLGDEDRGWNVGRYVPDTSAIRGDLGLTKTVNLEEAIKRTARWNGWNGANR